MRAALALLAVSGCGPLELPADICAPAYLCDETESGYQGAGAVLCLGDGYTVRWTCDPLRSFVEEGCR